MTMTLFVPDKAKVNTKRFVETRIGNIISYIRTVIVAELCRTHDNDVVFRHCYHFDTAPKRV